MSDEHCEVDFDGACDDAYPVELYQDKTIIARKAYVCTECGGAIAKGDRHLWKSYRFDGKFWCDRVCEPCREVAGEFTFTFIGGLLWESFQDEWDNGARLQGCLNRLTTARAKAVMTAKWQKWQEKREQQRRDAIRRRTERDSKHDGA